MAQKQSIALVALLVLGLAAVAMSASVLEDNHAPNEYACNACKTLVAGVNAALPGMKPLLLTLCGHIASEKENQKFREIVEAVSVEFSTKSPEVNCQNMGFCKKA